MIWWLAPLLGPPLVGFADDPKPAPAAGPMWVFVGTYTDRGSKGIYRLEFDPAKGTLSEPTVAAEVVNPSFLALHPSGRSLYAVGEVGQFEGDRTGFVAGYTLDAKAGTLTALNRESSGGPGPCHLAVDRSGKALFVANYGGGSVASFPLGDDGRIGKAASFHQREGSGVNKARQEGPHAHSVDVDPSNRFVVSADLGLDKVFIYRLDPARATLVPNDPPYSPVAVGSGPRHFAFHPDGKHGYVINEMASTIVAFDYDAARGALLERQSVSTLPPGFSGSSTTAEVRIHPSGKFLYGSNRGDDSIAAYLIDPKNGMLTWVETEPTVGKTPRSFTIDPTGRFLLAANQDSDSIVAFAIDPETGALTPNGQKVGVSRPVCLVFVPKGG